ncbi:MAG TPA: FtsX-like permease family protein [Pedococcus sp.]|uniref:FtsX-like permease family protein n=1 Tax=Pedococcus sp. TaxID=2860345 RepID=UPI002F923A97
MWAAIRYRRAQAAVLVLLAALITACAAFAPLYERGLEQALVRTVIDEAAPADTALTVRSGRSATNPELVSAGLEPNVPAALRALHEPGIGMVHGAMAVVPRAGLAPSPGEIMARTGACEHLRITTGRCPGEAGEVLVSAKDLAAWSWRAGQSFDTPVVGAPDGSAPVRLTVVGAYEVLPDEGYWMRTQVDGKSGTTVSRGLDIVPALDTWVTPEATFTNAWPQAQVSMTYPLRRNLVTVDTLAEVSAALSAPSTRPAGQGVNGALVESPLPTLVEQVRNGQGQVRVIVPLLMAQLGLLAAAILLLVAQAAVEQRRPELALARLRGRSRDAAGRLVMGELGLTVALGLPLGLALAVAMSELARRAVLPAGVPFEVPALTVVAVAAAAAVCVLAIWVAARPVRRQSVSALLRRVAPAERRGVGVVDLLVVALAVFGLIGLATGTLDGPLALATPTLIALAAGLLASRLAVLLAGASGRAALSRGRVGPALTAFGVERRPAMRNIVTVVSVATALTVFATNALVVADRNRAARAELETGAPAVMLTDSRNPGQLLDTVRAIDPAGERATPVAVVRPRDREATATMAVDPAGFGRVAYSPAGGSLRLRALQPPAVEPVQMEGTSVTGRLAWDLTLAGERTPSAAAPGQSGQPTTGNAGLPPAAASELRLSVTMPDGQRLTRTLAAVPLAGKGEVDLSAPLLCPQGCRLDALEFRKVDDFTPEVRGTLTLVGLGVDGRPLGLSDPSHWLPFAPPTPESTDVLRVVSPAPADTLALDVVNSGFVGRLAHADVPATLPGVLAGDVPPGGTAQSFPAVGVNGGQVAVRATQRVEALPQLGGKGVLVDFETLARLGGTLPDGATMSVWLADDSPALADTVAKGLAGAGIGVLSRHTAAEAQARFDESAAGWGLRLAGFTGAMAVLLAALVLVVMTVTGWRVVTRDMAALHLAGVPLGTLRRALVREQVLLVLVGSAVGAACGVVTALVAMPLVPLFDSPAALPRLQLAPSLPAVALAAAAAGAVLALVGAAVAVAAGRAIALNRVRESL